MMDAMGRVLIITAALLTGCAATKGPTVGQSLRSAEVALKGVDVRLGQDAEAWAELAELAMERCSSKDTADARRECLGAIAQSDRAAELAEQLGENYDAMVELLEAMRKDAAELEVLHEQARNEATP